MKPIFFLAFLLPFFASAQTIWPVQVGGSVGSATPPFYNPQQLTIELGDIVLWTNTSGTHNVNGSTQLFPANPEGFVSGNPQSGTWSFQHSFTIAGVYNYHCTQVGHSATQFGTITVIDPTGYNETADMATISLFPVPARDMLTVELGRSRSQRVEVLGLDGRLLGSFAVNGAPRLDLPVGNLAAGHYYLRLMDANGQAVVRPFHKE